ncbi:MAG: formyltetrahydrofolate deformylase [Solirubrobacterales bacterium]|jgi:formyltetrahydrofolate deformylase|nr:formyltetrahydrofolate deformylase [Solirubrobacterales bacterium]
MTKVLGEHTQADDGARRYTARLLVDCADRPGIIAAVSGFLFDQGANIVSSHQYSSDPSAGRFFLRTEFFLPDASHEGTRDREAHVSAATRGRLHVEFENSVAARFGMRWELRWWGQRPRVAILASRHDHCLLDLLWRWRREELEAQIVAVISNHRDLERQVRAAGVPFHHVPVELDGRAQAEAAMLALLRGKAELLVLARYMQVLSAGFLARVGMPAINIHHSFLPAFAGADPYRRARERGVKLIGATAHYVTERLDDGPIIDQDVVRVDHRQSVRDLERVGRDVERLVLARAVSLHLDDRVIVDGRRTIVF